MGCLCGKTDDTTRMSETEIIKNLQPKFDMSKARPIGNTGYFLIPHQPASVESPITSEIISTTPTKKMNLDKSPALVAPHPTRKIVSTTPSKKMDPDKQLDQKFQLLDNKEHGSFEDMYDLAKKPSLQTNTGHLYAATDLATKSAVKIEVVQKAKLKSEIENGSFRLLNQLTNEVDILTGKSLVYVHIDKLFLNDKNYFLVMEQGADSDLLTDYMALPQIHE